LIAHYNERDLPAGPDRLPQLLSTLLFRRIRVQGFIILDHYVDGYAEFQRDMSAWVAAGRVKLRKEVVNGLEHAPAALNGLLDGRNLARSWCALPTDVD